MTIVERQIRAKKFKRRVEWWARKLNVQTRQIRVQKMTRKWASCSSEGWVTFSDDLLSGSRAFQKHVIVHELLHLQVPNHGKLFKSLLKCYLGEMSPLCNCRSDISSPALSFLRR